MWFLSRLHPKKGLEFLIPAYAEAHTAEDVLVLAGPAHSERYLAELEEKVHQNNIENRVVFTGILNGPERIEAFVDAEIFALPSHQENFGIVVAEALACRLVVVISDRVNLCDFVRDHEVGKVIPRDTKALANALRSLLDDKQALAVLGVRAREAAFREFDWSLIGHRWKKQYQDMVNQYRSSRSEKKRIAVRSLEGDC